MQRRLPAPHQVSESKLSSVLGRTHEVLSGACATSLGTPEVVFSKLSKAATLRYHLEDITPEDLPYHKDALFIQDRTTLLHNLTNLSPTCGEICLQVLDQMVAKKHFLFSTDSHHPQSIKTWRGWGAGVQRRLFWLDHRQGKHTTVRCSVQMTTTRSSSATSCCEYGVLNRQLQGCS